MGKHFGVASIVFLLFDCLHLWNSVKYIGWCVGDPENLIVCAFVCLQIQVTNQSNSRWGNVFVVGLHFLLAGFVFFAYMHVCLFVCCVCRSLDVGVRQIFICVCRRSFYLLFFMR